jgi:hypothetical protein
MTDCGQERATNTARRWGIYLNSTKHTLAEPWVPELKSDSVFAKGVLQVSVCFQPQNDNCVMHNPSQ